MIRCPEGEKPITTKWVVKAKPDKLKARLTARGFVQQFGIDYNETFAPVLKLTTLRVFLSLVGSLNLRTLILRPLS